MDENLQISWRIMTKSQHRQQSQTRYDQSGFHFADDRNQAHRFYSIQSQNYFVDFVAFTDFSLGHLGKRRFFHWLGPLAFGSLRPFVFDNCAFQHECISLIPPVPPWLLLALGPLCRPTGLFLLPPLADGVNGRLLFPEEIGGDPEIVLIVVGLPHLGQGCRHVPAGHDHWMEIKFCELEFVVPLVWLVVAYFIIMEAVVEFVVVAAQLVGLVRGFLAQHGGRHGYNKQQSVGNRCRREKNFCVFDKGLRFLFYSTIRFTHSPKTQQNINKQHQLSVIFGALGGGAQPEPHPGRHKAQHADQDPQCACVTRALDLEDLRGEQPNGEGVEQVEKLDGLGVVELGQVVVERVGVGGGGRGWRRGAAGVGLRASCRLLGHE